MPADLEDLERRIEWIEFKLQRLETKWDGKLDNLGMKVDTIQDRINLLILAAAGVLASVTLALFAIILGLTS